ncbi:DUF2851 family protein [Flaviaesturariibacter flavus]|uniref:DUF2851 family protein n=1 Tax=Flaviaesturariibacter flavus TaxID=2502780 RepID=A0A4R1BP08_9BACT|nr:DUF2851 family protein [Flaviaesturariibacter flavus]TCJ19178.1 DUF2851 family protein [Flaviaesturariibacter flavus]
MTEKLLQFIWQHGYFHQGALRTPEGETVQLLHRGQLNTNEGPDFLEARLRVGNTLLAGSVELHLRTSDWDRHRHSADPNYRNVILHAVYVHDRPAVNSQLPLVELQPHIPAMLLERYEGLMQNAGFIPCERELAAVPSLIWTGWKDRLLAERLMEKTRRVAALLEGCGQSWETVFWWLLARNFGMRVNADAFEEVARSLPVPLLLRHRGSIHQLEALLLGQANQLQRHFSEDYPKLLQREYRYLRQLHPLKPVHRALHFLRMRPPAFPTVRLAQLAMLLHRQEHLLERLLETESLEALLTAFDITANDYWHYHYRFDEESGFAPKHLGQSMAESIAVNTLVPVLFAWGQLRGDLRFKERALGWLQQLPAETNSILGRFAKLGVGADNAGDAQALLYLEKSYCAQRRCLECAAGNALLKRDLSATARPGEPSSK